MGIGTQTLLARALAPFLAPTFLDLPSAGARRWPDGDASVEAQLMRRACEWGDPSAPDTTGLKCFIRACFPHLTTQPFSAMHEDFFRLHTARRETRGHRDVTAAPRGSAKTTIKGFIWPLHDILYAHERYILICAANADLARDKVKALRDELEDNAELGRLYGLQRTNAWKQTDFITMTGVRVRAITPHTKVRGLLWRGHRPSKILLDDAEDPEGILTELRRTRFFNWMQADISKLGTADTNIDVIGTVLHPESLLAKLMENPGYTAHYYQAVLQFASGEQAWDLWRQWREIILNLADQRRLTTARTFFDTHENDMVAGSQVLWPERESYYDLMLGRVIDGETAFFTEKQNTPMADQRYLFDMDAAAYCTVTPDGIQRHDGSRITWLDIVDIAAFFDPALGRGKDCACCVVVARDRTGYEYVIGAYINNTDSPETQDHAIVALLWQWQCALIGVEINGFQSLLPKNLREAVAQHNASLGSRWELDIVPITHSRSKALRIKTLEPLLVNHWLQFSRTLPHELFRQFREFIPLPDAGRDDAPDAVEGAVSLVRGVHRKQDNA